MTKSAGPTFLSIALTFVAAAAFYVIAYSWLAKRQTGKGPWEVTFAQGDGGVAEIVIAQPRLGLSNIHVQFVGETATNSPVTVRFTRPKMTVPFGEVIYDDLMFLPGTLTLDLFGHEVELLPRVLVLNRQPLSWSSGTTNTLWPTNKLPGEIRKQVKGGYRTTR